MKKNKELGLTFLRMRPILESSFYEIDLDVSDSKHYSRNLEPGEADMKADAEKKRKFHESLLQLLYPPPPPKEDNHDSVYATQGSYLDQITDDLKLERGFYSSSTDQGEGESEGECDTPKNLTRAQRKRLRRKKLKEAASNRRKFIGPMLPSYENDAAAAAVNDEVAVGVPQNPDIGAKNPETEPTSSCSKRNKQKHRRMAKKLAGERLKFSSTVDQGGNLSENEHRGS